VTSGGQQAEGADVTVVCRVGDVPEGRAKRVVLEGYPPLAVFNVGGEYFVTDDTCTHVEASLADGTIEGDVVKCPFHRGRFHIPTGKVVSRPPKRDLTTYPTAIVGDDVVLVG